MQTERSINYFASIHTILSGRPFNEKREGWAIPSSFLPVSIVLGSVVKKPGVVGNRIEIREFLQLSVAIDHDVVDGAPATRFVAYLGKLIESGYSL